MGTSSKTSSSAAVTGVGFKLIGAISNLQSESEVERCWLFFIKEIAPVFAAVLQKNKALLAGLCIAVVKRWARILILEIVLDFENQSYFWF